MSASDIETSPDIKIEVLRIFNDNSTITIMGGDERVLRSLDKFLEALNQNDIQLPDNTCALLQKSLEKLDFQVFKEDIPNKGPASQKNETVSSAPNPYDAFQAFIHELEKHDPKIVLGKKTKKALSAAVKPYRPIPAQGTSLEH